MLIKIIALTITSFFAISAFSQNSLEPVEVARTPTYSEGPVFDAEGNFYVSEPFRGPITRIAPSSESSEWAVMEGTAGHKILEDGTHIVCDVPSKAIYKLNPDGEVLGKVALDCGGELLRLPNDLTLDTHGGFYFTDSRTQEDSIGRVGYVDASGQSHLLAEWVGYPNGIVLSADGKVLYIAEFDMNEIWSFSIHSPGHIGSKKIFAKLPDMGEEFGGPDGIAFDDAGNLYVTHFGMGQIQVLSPEGELIQSLPAGQLWVSNLTFGGPNGNPLYMTGCPKGKARETGIVYKLDLSEAH